MVDTRTSYCNTSCQFYPSAFYQLAYHDDDAGIYGPHELSLIYWVNVVYLDTNIS